LAPRLLQQVPPQGLIAAGGAQLQDIGKIFAGQNRGAGSAEFVQREKRARRARHRKADDLFAESTRDSGGRRFRSLQQRAPIHSTLGRFARHEAAAAHLSGDQPFGFQHFVSCRNGSPVQSKLASQFPRGWQALAPSQLP
jgi:hypothetical protein